MSHIVLIETRVHDAVALTMACRRLGLAEPVQGSVRLFSADAAALAIQPAGQQRHDKVFCLSWNWTTGLVGLA